MPLAVSPAWHFSMATTPSTGTLHDPVAIKPIAPRQVEGDAALAPIRVAFGELALQLVEQRHRRGGVGAVQVIIVDESDQRRRGGPYAVTAFRQIVGDGAVGHRAAARYQCEQQKQRCGPADPGPDPKAHGQSLLALSNCNAIVE